MKIDMRYHKSRETDVPAFEAVRDVFEEAQAAVLANVPEGRRQSMVLSKLDEGLLIAIRAITEADREPLEETVNQA